MTLPEYLAGTINSWTVYAAWSISPDNHMALDARQRVRAELAVLRSTVAAVNNRLPLTQEQAVWWAWALATHPTYNNNQRVNEAANFAARTVARQQRDNELAAIRLERTA